MKKLATFLSIVAMAAVTPLARADVAISVNGTNCSTVNGVLPTDPGGETGACLSVTSGTATISILSTKGTQSPTDSRQFSSTLEIDTTGATTVTLDLAANDFTAPNTPPDITDAFSYTINLTKGAVNSSKYSACVDGGNGLTAPTGTCGSPAGISGSGTISNASSTGQILITSLVGSFSLNQELVLDLGANTAMTVTLSQTLTQVPEPAAILLFGTMIVGVTTVVRRRAVKRS